jgi:WD40 repeat protein
MPSTVARRRPCGLLLVALARGPCRTAGPGGGTGHRGGSRRASPPARGRFDHGRTQVLVALAGGAFLRLRIWASPCSLPVTGAATDIICPCPLSPPRRLRDCAQAATGWETGNVVFIADDLAAWLTGLLADAGRKKLTTLVFGTDQNRALRSAATAAVRLTAKQLRPEDDEQAEHLALVMSQVFSEPVPSAPLAGHETVLEALQAGIAGQMGSLDDASLTEVGQSSADVLEVPGAVLAEKLTAHLLREIVARGASGGPLTPLAAQLNHDVTHMQGQRLESMVGLLTGEMREALDRLDSTQIATADPVGLERLQSGDPVWVAVKPGNLSGHAFLSYVREDSGQVDQLQRTLEAAGIPVWRDTADLWPGEDWRMKIRSAITDNALVFIACFSQASLDRGKSYQNEELTLAIEQLRLRSPDDPWLIPVRFDDCDIPDRDIGGGRTLTSIQRADLFGDRFDEGAPKLVAAILRILRRDADGILTCAREVAREAGLEDSSRHPDGDADNGKARADASDSPEGLDRGTEATQDREAGPYEALEKKANEIRGAAKQLPSWHRRLAVGTGLIVIAAGVLVGFFALNNHSAPPPTTSASPVGFITDPNVPDTVAFSPDNRTLASGSATFPSSKGATHLWNVTTHALAATLHDTGSKSVLSVAFSSHGDTLAVADLNGNTYLWNVAAHALTTILHAPRGSLVVESVAFSPDGTTLAGGGADGNTYLWNEFTHNLTATLHGTGYGGVFSVAFGPHGDMLASAVMDDADDNGSTYLWNVATHALLATFHDPESKGPQSVAFSPRGSMLAVGDGNGNAYLWDVATHALAAILQNSPAGSTRTVVPAMKDATSVAFSPRGSTVAVGEINGSTYLWDVATHTLTAILHDPRASFVTSVAFSPDGTVLATGDDNGRIYLWDMRKFRT